MSLEKHYQAAEEAIIAMAHSDSPRSCGVCRRRAKAAVDAFLSSLADDPPEEMVEAAARPPGSHGRVAEHFAWQSLSAALREASRGDDG